MTNFFLIHFFVYSNEIIIGENFYRILKSFSTIVNKYNFINHIDYQTTESNRYSIYNIKRKNIFGLNDIVVNDNKDSFDEKQLGSSIEEFKKNNNIMINFG